MNASTTAKNASTMAVTSSASVNSPAFWESLWRTSGIQFAVFFIITYVIYGYQPQVGASQDALVAFYSGDRTRMLGRGKSSEVYILHLLQGLAPVAA